MIRHFLNTQDLSRAELDALLDEAARLKQSPLGKDLEGRTIALLFFTRRCARARRSRSEPGSWGRMPSCWRRARMPGVSSSSRMGDGW
jgi:hypothetical protein